jgi:hypothetical protein
MGRENAFPPRHSKKLCFQNCFALLSFFWTLASSIIFFFDILGSHLAEVTSCVSFARFTSDSSQPQACCVNNVGHPMQVDWEREKMVSTNTRAHQQLSRPYHIAPRNEKKTFCFKNTFAHTHTHLGIREHMLHISSIRSSTHKLNGKTERSVRVQYTHGIFSSQRSACGLSLQQLFCLGALLQLFAFIVQTAFLTTPIDRPFTQLFHRLNCLRN